MLLAVQPQMNYIWLLSRKGDLPIKIKYVRWIALLISLAIEAIAFWIIGPQVDPNLSFTNQILVKATNAESWTLVGWVSLSLAWLWAEIVRSVYINGRRTRRTLAQSDSNQELVHETGLHWLVLLRDIRTGKFNDGLDAALTDPLVTEGLRRATTWYAVWIPVWFAITTLVFFVGWTTWVVGTLPDMVSTSADSVRSLIEMYLPASVAQLPSALIASLPKWLSYFYEIARENTFFAVLSLAAIWMVFYWLERNFLKRSFPIALLIHVINFLALLGLLFVVLSSMWLDWLTVVYTVLPNNGPVAMGFFLLNIASAFYLPHIATWSSWRYAIVQDPTTLHSSILVLGGVLNSNQKEFNLQRIVDTQIKQLWWQRVLRIGDVELIDIGGKHEILRHVSRPNKLRHQVKKAIRDFERKGVEEDKSLSSATDMTIYAPPRIAGA